MNGIYRWVQGINQRSPADKSKTETDLIMLAYVACISIFDRTKAYGWPEDAKIVVTEISRSRITLGYAVAQTVGRIEALATQFDLEDEVTEIMGKGPLFYEVERDIPDHIKSKII